MTQMIVVAAAAIGMIVFVAFIAARLVRARTAGMSIRMQIFLALALIVGAFSFGLGLMVLDRIKARADLIGSQSAQGEARVVAALVAADIESRGANLRDVARKLTTDRGVAGLNLALFDASGAKVLDRGTSPDEDGTVAASAPIIVRGQTIGRARVVKPTLVIERTLADFAPTVLVISLLLGAVAAGAAALIGGTIATPIESLTRFAERVSEGDRRAPPPLGHGREVARLSRALDSMRRELQGRPFVETFAADLSHELKNPVAAIRASSEVLRDGAAAEPEQAAHFLGRILEATGRIEALLGDLLSLARLEARGVEHAQSIDLHDCAQEAARASRDLGVAILVESDGSSAIRGDADSLARAIENLIDNARLHGDGKISVQIARRVRESQEEVVCRVINEGSVARGVRKRIFRRFVTTRKDRGGTGLGLAIVRAVAEAHGGRATCSDFGPPEVVFELSFPAS